MAAQALLRPWLALTSLLVSLASSPKLHGSDLNGWVGSMRGEVDQGGA
jgi:hypothetical protein